MPSPLRDKAIGRWRDLLMAFGVDRSYLTGKHGPCPICMGGKDRFRFDNDAGTGSFFCSTCGAGDGFLLLQKIKGISFKEAAALVEEKIGEAGFEKPKAKLSEGSRRNKLNELWASSRPIHPGDPVGRYPGARLRGPDQFPGSLRTVRSLDYHDGRDLIGSWPAMVAMVMEPAPSKSQMKALSGNGDVWSHKPVTIHRTWVSPKGNGDKAPVEDARRMMRGDTPVGSYIPLSESRTVLGIAEGIETALAAAEMFGIPTWAAINAHNLAHWNPPPGTEHVVIFGDADHSFTGQAAAYTLGRRLKLQEKIEATVRIPPQLGTDWNDVFLQGNEGTVRVLNRNSNDRGVAAIRTAV